jgi:phosphoglycerol transferase MdoB-like AlkP superfamily enzyme
MTQMKAITATIIRFFTYLPALVLGMAILRLVELGTHASQIRALLFPAIGNDLLALVRYLPFIFLLSLPGLAMRNRVARLAWIGVTWSLLLIVQGALIAYQRATSVLLGSDLFGYSWKEIQLILAGHRDTDLLMAASMLVVIALMLYVLVRKDRIENPGWKPPYAIAVLALSVPAFFLLPNQLEADSDGHQDLGSVAANKAAFFADANLNYLLRPAPAASAGSAADAAYPFVHAETTPDTLGPYFNQQPTPPNLVLIIVEGLGRSFSGPGARLGSFTPFLDELAGQSLYWDNFVAPQGRTFGILPSLLGSLPYGEHGFSSMGKNMPAHASLVSILRSQGYRTRYFTGTNLEFDNQGQFLARQGTDVISGLGQFDPGVKRGNEWGYADRELFDHELKFAGNDTCKPCLTVIQTVTMHDPFTFPELDEYKAKVTQRLDQLKIAADKRAPYQADAKIFASILYTDDALRHYFNEVKKQAGYDNTIFIITGDHRLPELPMSHHLERYHVPLIVYSPLLKAPEHIRSISSQFDVTPSLLALLSHQYGLKTPAQASWLGSGLDMEPGFRNVHAFPLKQTKTDLNDYISGNVLLSQGRLFSIADGMEIDLLDNQGARKKAAAQFNAFKAINAALERNKKLVPASVLEAPALGYEETKRKLQTATLAADLGNLWVSKAKAEVVGDELQLSAQFANRADSDSPEFVPLLVVTDASGRELGESYGKATKLASNAGADVELRMKLKLPAGNYFASVIVSHPDTGKPIGQGQYHIPFTR